MARLTGPFKFIVPHLRAKNILVKFSQKEKILATQGSVFCSALRSQLRMEASEHPRYLNIVSDEDEM